MVMAEAAVPVDLFNPGQVFACLGLLEAADVLLGDAEGGFDWSDEADVRFVLRAAGERNPVEAVLAFLAQAEVVAVAPGDWEPKKKPNPEKKPKAFEKYQRFLGTLHRTDHAFPEPAPDTESALPIFLRSKNGWWMAIEHWADGSSRETFKLYSGNRSAAMIAENLISLIRPLWQTQREALLTQPFHILCPMGGSFNFDPRGAWNSIDTGYSLNEHRHSMMSSPVVELLAACGLQHARPWSGSKRTGEDARNVRYATWGMLLPPILARAAFGTTFTIQSCRLWRFRLSSSGKNKIVTFAAMEP